MNNLRKYSGVVWLLLAPAAIIFILWNAVAVLSKADKIIAAANSDKARILAEAARTNSILQWSIITVIFIPIAIGLMIFGKYALQGEYDR